MENKFAKKILFSYIPLKGWYRYREAFQLVPVPSDAPKPPVEMGHYPCILELSYNPGVYPDRDSIYWHRDIWERKRFEEMARKSANLKSAPTNDQEQAIRYQTGLLRKPAIINEISRLLTLFTNFRFFDYEHIENRWFISIGNNINEFSSPIWGQPFYSIEKQSEPLSEFSTPVVNKANIVPTDTYYKSTRDAYYAGEDNQIALPQCIDKLFDTYFSLEDDEKRAYFSSCYLYCQSLELRFIAPSLSLIAAVSAIESLINCGVKLKECPECHAPLSKEKPCKNCGAPRFRVSRRFKDFILEHGSPTLNKFADKFYGFRSSIGHQGSLLRDDLYDTGFYVGHKDEQKLFIKSALKVTRGVILNWLISKI